MKLKKYNGREGEGEFVPLTLEEMKSLRYGDLVWVIANGGDARGIRVNGRPKTWKRDPSRVEVPVKYGLYECDRISEVGRLIKEVK